VREAEDFTAICNPRCIETLCTSAACYSYSVIFLLFSLSLRRHRDNLFISVSTALLFRPGRFLSFIIRVGFEPTIPVFERVKTFHDLHRAATVIGSCSVYTGKADNSHHPAPIFGTPGLPVHFPCLSVHECCHIGFSLLLVFCVKLRLMFTLLLFIVTPLHVSGQLHIIKLCA
jgi:hypothetical protein